MWCSRTRALCAFHKTGTAVARVVWNRLSREAVKTCTAVNGSFVDGALSIAETSGWVTSATRSVRKATNVGLEMVEHAVCLVRDPYAIVVSGYSFHKLGGEQWTKWPLSNHFRTHSHAWLSDSFNSVIAALAALPAHGKTLYSARVGPATDDVWPAPQLRLPPLERGESYMAYLQRLPVKEGLFVEAHRARIATFPFLWRLLDSDMNRTHRVCLESLQSDPSRQAPRGEHLPSSRRGVMTDSGSWPNSSTCRSGWTHVLAALALPLALAPIASSVCGLPQHGGSSPSSMRRAEESLFYAQVAEIDRARFGGELSTLRSALGCMSIPPMEPAWDGYP